MGLLRRFLNTLRSRRLGNDLEDELNFHRQMRIRKARDRGLSLAEAEQDANRRMGNIELAKEEMRDYRVVAWLASTLQDLRHGFALLRRDAGVSSLIVMVLALGISGNTAIFMLVKAAFLDPLPFRDASRLVTIVEVTRGTPNTSEFLQLRALNRAFQDIACAEYRDMQLSGRGEPQRVFAARVTASFFPLLGVQASLGRTFLPTENQTGQTPSVVLTDAFGRAHLGADPQAIGKILRLDGKAALVVGVLPPHFQFDYPTLEIPETVDVYVAYPLETNLPISPSYTGTGVTVRVIARLRDGVTLAQAETDVSRIARILTKAHPEAFPNPWNDPSRFTYLVVPLREAIVGNQRSMLWLLLSGVGILLLIACANAAQLLLGRALRRGREVAIRTALGARRLRLIRQLLLEGLVLAVCGGLLGVLLAAAIVRVVLHVLPVPTPLYATAGIDIQVIGFTAAISLFSAVVFATIPAIKGSRWMPGPSLTARSSAGEGNRWRNIMIAVEAGLSVCLLCGAALFVENLWTLVTAPMGFDPNHVLAMRLQLPSQAGNLRSRQAGIVFRRYLEKLAAYRVSIQRRP